MSKIKEKIESAGYKQVEDRDMSESNGYLYEKDNKNLQYWTMYPRVRVSLKNDVMLFDTDIRTEEELLIILESKL